ncbi:MAG: hypothetical protein H0U86_00100 [Chloroflexi bacterium]|nr:hypothetical protein [Chloroflexota bacterium]
MDPNVLLPFGSSALSFVFAALVADQWWRRRQPYQLVWTLGMLWYGIGAGTEFLGGAFGWNEALYRTWYAFGAFGVAAYLGLGTIFLLNRTRFGYFVALSFALAALFSFLAASRYAREGSPAADAIVLAVVGIALVAAVAVAVATRVRRQSMAPVAAGFLIPGSVVAAVLAFVVPLDAPGFALDALNGAPIGAAFPAGLRIVTPPFNIVGAFALIFGAAYSAYIFMPKRRIMRADTRGGLAAGPLRGIAVVVNAFGSLPSAWRALRAGELNSRVPATLLIALGGFFPSIADGLTRFGVTWGLFLGQFIGVLLIFLGFLVSIEVFSDVRLPFTRIVLRRRDGGGQAAG